MVEIDRFIKARDSHLSDLEQLTITVVKLSVTYLVTSERVCSVK